MQDNEFVPETLEYIKKVSVRHRKALGQYFTPRSAREMLLNKLPKIHNATVLDPGCGTGEFLLSAKGYFPNAQLFGWDIDEELAKVSKKVVPDAHIEHIDTTQNNDCEKYDFVIGNPPYYEFHPDTQVKKRYREIISGRLNIYTIFVYQGIRLLKNGGYLAYVISPSMNNGAFFTKLRNYIVNTCNIEYLSVLDSPDLFHGALQSVMLLVLKKGKNKGDYIFRKNGIVIFSDRVKELYKASEGKSTLSELGYTVRTGRLVWNQNKSLLTNDPEGNIPLLWAHNITSDGLILNNKDKPQYVRITEGYDIGPAIVVNRIVGRPGAGRIRAALIPYGMRFIGENHLNVIFPPQPQQLIPKDKEVKLDEVLKQLNSPEKMWVIQTITGNTQISKNELEKLFPIDY